MKIAVDGAKLFKQLSRGVRGQLPVSSTAPRASPGPSRSTRVEVCNAVLDVMAAHRQTATGDHQPAGHGGECSMPHVYANQIEYMLQASEIPRQRGSFSLHPHNDRGCGVADAGAGGCWLVRRRVEGYTLRQRRAHRQRGRHHAGYEYVQRRAWTRSLTSAICPKSAKSTSA